VPPPQVRGESAGMATLMSQTSTFMLPVVGAQQLRDRPARCRPDRRLDTVLARDPAGAAPITRRAASIDPRAALGPVQPNLRDRQSLASSCPDPCDPRSPAWPPTMPAARPSRQRLPKLCRRTLPAGDNVGGGTGGRAITGDGVLLDRVHRTDRVPSAVRRPGRRRGGDGRRDRRPVHGVGGRVGARSSTSLAPPLWASWVSIGRICRRIWYAGKGFMTWIIHGEGPAAGGQPRTSAPRPEFTSRTGRPNGDLACHRSVASGLVDQRRSALSRIATAVTARHDGLRSL
jgi:hypothetical protein